MKKRIACVIAAVLVACFLVFPAGSAFGDAGGYSGGSDYSSGGGSSWGGSSSGSDWGSSGSSDWGSSSWGSSIWDDDSSSSTSDDEYDDEYLESGDGAFSDSDDSDMGGLDFAIIGGVIVILFMVSFVKFVNGRARKRNGGAGNRPVHIQDTFDASKLHHIVELCEIDPAFRECDMQEKMANWYVQLQNAWTAKNLESMRPHMSDGLYAQFDRQLDMLRMQHQTNYVANIAVLGVEVDGWYVDGNEERLVARLRTRIIDYNVDDNTGAVVSGSKTAEKFMTYRWTLSRTAGTKTQEESGTKAVNCPNCGAVLNINKTSKCPYCDSIVTVDSHDWVISAIQGLEQITR